MPRLARYTLAALLLALLNTAPARSQPYAAPPAGLNWGGVFRKFEPQVTSNVPHPAIARVIVQERDGIAFGSGTLVDVDGDQGLLITNWHVVRDAAGEIEVTFPDGFRSKAKVLKTDRDWDLAALVIWKPNVTPVPLAASAARPGEPLSISGYGSGQFRAVQARCTQYVSPGARMPYEMVEVSAEARQGDSGGPILNERGEMAGVLFGAGGGTTSGSYVGRVRWFLASVSPRLGDPNAAAQQVNIASTNPFTVPQTGVAGDSVATTPVALQPTSPATDTWHAAAKPSATAPVEADSAVLQPITSATPARVASRRSQVTFGALPDMDAAEEPVAVGDALVATRPTQPIFARPLPKAEHGPAELTGKGLGAAAPSAVTDASEPSAGSFAALWQILFGKSPVEQGKTLLAVLGIAAVLSRFWR